MPAISLLQNVVSIVDGKSTVFNKLVSNINSTINIKNTFQANCQRQIMLLQFYALFSVSLFAIYYVYQWN